MRIAILSNTLPAALPIYDKLIASAGGHDVFIILCPASQSAAQNLGRHFARWVIRKRRWQSLELLRQRKVVFLAQRLDHPQSLRRLKQLSLDVGLHKSGTIYRQSTIDSFRLGILNAHIGLLPQYRGRNVMEWTLLQGDRPGISVFFIDAGIDTGARIILAEQIDISHCRTISEARHYLFNQDAEFYSRAIEVIKSDETKHQLNDGSSLRYYVMSNIFRGVVEDMFRSTDRQ